MNRLKIKNDNHFTAGLLFASPWLIGFLLFFLWPFVASIYWSFCRFDLVNTPQWIGLDNYRRLAAEIGTDNGFGNALTNTLYYALISVPLSVAAGVGLALLLSIPIRGQAVYRTLVFLPSIIPVVATSVLWIWLLDPESGLVNYLLSWIGVSPQNWLKQSQSAISPAGFSAVGNWLGGDGRPLRLMGSKDALIMMTVWGVGNFVVIYLAAIGEIPKSLHEAAEIDGASSINRIMHITLPMLSPVIFFNVVMGLIHSVQAFTAIYILSEGTGQPGGSLKMISLQMFLSGFDDLEMGYASAMAWLLFVALVAATLALFRTSRYWVYYRFVK